MTAAHAASVYELHELLDPEAHASAMAMADAPATHPEVMDLPSPAVWRLLDEPLCKRPRIDTTTSITPASDHTIAPHTDIQPVVLIDAVAGDRAMTKDNTMLDEFHAADDHASK